MSMSDKIRAKIELSERLRILSDHPNMWADYWAYCRGGRDSVLSPSECDEDEIQKFWNWLEPIMKEGRKIWATELKADEYQRFDGGAG